MDLGADLLNVWLTTSLKQLCDMGAEYLSVCICLIWELDLRTYLSVYVYVCMCVCVCCVWVYDV